MIGYEQNFEHSSGSDLPTVHLVMSHHKFSSYLTEWISSMIESWDDLVICICTLVYELMIAHDKMHVGDLGQKW
jgi:hypothetical protein